MPRKARVGRAPTPARASVKRSAKPTASPAPTPEVIGLFRLGVIPGATPGKWIDAWKERMPRAPLELIALDVAAQRAALDDGRVDAALVRVPISAEGLHLISLYDEVAVVVTSIDSSLTVAEELEISDLAGEVYVVPEDAALRLDIPGVKAPRFAPPTTTEDAVATVAAGVGFLVVPMSIARLYQRKDLASRPLRGAGTSTVALAWPAERTTAAVEAFVGIVRGRTANSSRA
nr:LysR substrate-binding domain-containing protein [Microbacterium endophyticum]